MRLHEILEALFARRPGHDRSHGHRGAGPRPAGSGHRHGRHGSVGPPPGRFLPLRERQVGRQHADPRRSIRRMAALRCCASAPRSACARSSKTRRARRRRPDRSARRSATSTRASWTSRRIESLGITPLKGELAAIAAITDKKDLPAAFARAAQVGVRLPFSVNVGADQRNSEQYAVQISQSGLGMPDRDYYLRNDEKFAATRKAYATYISRLFALGNQPDPEGAAARIARARDRRSRSSSGIARATAIATPPTTRWASTSLQASTPHFDWQAYLSALPGGAKDKVKEVIVRQPDYMKAIDAIIADVPLATWKEYLTFGLISAYADGLSRRSPIRDFEFNGRVIAGRQVQQPRWKRGVNEVEQALGEPVGRLYIERHFKPEAKARMDALIRNLLAAFKVGIDELEWMSPRNQATGAGQARQVPPEDRLSRSVARLLGARGQARRSRRQPAALPRIPDRRVVVASRQAGRALALGLHAADRQRVVQRDQQRDHLPCRHPAAAVLRSRCRRCDQLRRDRRGDRPRDQPRLRRPGPQVGRRRQPARLVDGRRREAVRRARGEARRAVRVVHAAAGHEDQRPPDDGREHRRLERHRGRAIAPTRSRSTASRRRSIGGFTGDQRFFLGYAQIWRFKSRDEALRNQLLTDSHSPGYYRAFVPLTNIDAFYTAFNLKPGDKLYRAPEDRVKIW